MTAAVSIQGVSHSFDRFKARSDVSLETAAGEFALIGGRDMTHVPPKARPATGILFSGDIVYDGALIEGTSAQERTDYHASMTRLYHLPVRVVHGGHFPSYDGARHRAIIKVWLDEKGRA